MAGVLVTGALGESGRWIVDALVEDGHQVTAVDQQRLHEEPLIDSDLVDVRVINMTDGGDVLELIHEVDPSVVVHWAAYTSTDYSAPGHVFHNNVVSTYYTLVAAGQVSATVVFASSDAVYGYNQLPTQFPITVKEPCRPGDAYSLSKFVSEEIGRTVVRKYDIDVWALRTTWIQYPGEYECLDIQEAPEYGTRNYWSYCDIRDVVTAVRAAIKMSADGFHAFNITAADNYMGRSTSELLREHFGKLPDDVDLSDDESAYSSCYSTEVLNWSPSYSWRSAANEEVSGTASDKR